MTVHDVAALGTIVGVWAHPDDEAWLSAGIMALAVGRGQRVVCVTATRGEAGDPTRTPEETARVREGELAESLRILGVTEHHWLDYVDATLAHVDAGEPTSRIAAILDTVQADTVLTFGPDGMTGHPDHVAVSAWATAAARSTGRASVHYASVRTDVYDAVEPTFERLGVFMGGRPPRIQPTDLSIDIALPEWVWASKFAALRAQRSQLEGLIAEVGEGFLRLSNGAEQFRTTP